MPFSSVADVIAAVLRERADAALLPVENAISGIVGESTRALADAPELAVERELVIPVHLELLAARGASLGSVRRVLSFPVATAQCRRFLDERLPYAEIEATNSTSEAARRVTEIGSDDTAAIASSRAGKRHGLVVLASSIEDSAENWTRFVLVRRIRDEPVVPSSVR